MPRTPQPRQPAPLRDAHEAPDPHETPEAQEAAAEAQEDLDGGLIPVNSVDEIPAFATEAQEAAFWSTHSFGEGLLAQARSVPLEGDDLFGPARARSPRDDDNAESATTGTTNSRLVAVRLDAEILRRLKAVAAKKQRRYQPLLKEFIIQRLYEEEKREGLLAP
jgi:hypothetical protein